MFSENVSNAAAALRGMASRLRDTAEAAGAALTRIDSSIDDVGVSWSGSAPSEFAALARAATRSIASWPNSIDAAADSLERWAGHGDDIAADARRAERRLSTAYDVDVDVADRDVTIRSARSLSTEIAERWVNICRHQRLQLDASMSTLATLADRPWVIGDDISRATRIATRVAALDMDLDLIDSTGNRPGHDHRHSRRHRSVPGGAADVHHPRNSPRPRPLHR